MTSAARLAARAAQRMGAGLVTIGTSTQSAPIYQQSLESIIVRIVDTNTEWHALLDDPKKTVLLIGPGMGLGDFQKSLVLSALATQKPCVLDADGLTNFAGAFDQLRPHLHSHCVLTPHEGEFERLFGAATNSKDDRVSRADQAVKLAGCVVLLKGAETVIAAPDGQTILNTNAPPWLATSGSGDVLAGMITGLLAQKMPPCLAAAAAAWMHGQIATTFGPGLIAEDIVDGVPKILSEIICS